MKTGTLMFLGLLTVIYPELARAQNDVDSTKIIAKHVSECKAVTKELKRLGIAIDQSIKGRVIEVGGKLVALVVGETIGVALKTRIPSGNYKYLFKLGIDGGSDFIVSYPVDALRTMVWESSIEDAEASCIEYSSYTPNFNPSRYMLNEVKANVSQTSYSEK